ncbi:MAG TPA: cyclase family protein [Gemmatimonadales bacterium]|nr:cyclase family protein [Gemmatimonadales bacterium]
MKLHHLLTVALVAVGCRASAPGSRSLAVALASGSWVDLSYSFDSSTIYWPTAQPFHLQVVSAQRTPGGWYYAANNFAAAEHGGTHLDAPVHFAEGRHTTDQVPLEQLIGPAVVVDLTAQVAREGADYLITPAALEAAGLDSAAGMIVLFRTGWGSRWPDRLRYLGTTKTGQAAVPELHFPGIHPNAARWLRDRHVRAVGIDTPSIDYGQSQTFETHQILLGADIPAFENVAHLEQLPARGAFVVALPMKIAGGSGGPLRMVAWVGRSEAGASP